MLSQTGFLLSYIRYGDYDAVLHCFTKENGFCSFFVKGIYSQKNRKKAYLQPLNELSYLGNQKSGNGKLENISRIELASNRDLHLDMKSNAIVFFAADFLNSILRLEGSNADLYENIRKFLTELENKNYSAHLILMIRILEYSGVLPLSGNQRYLDPQSGTFSESSTHHLFDEEISSLWKKLISSEDPYEVKFPNSLRKQLLDSILVYCHYHITDFRTPHSLEIVQQLFS